MGTGGGGRGQLGEVRSLSERERGPMLGWMLIALSDEPGPAVPRLLLLGTCSSGCHLQHTPNRPAALAIQCGAVNCSSTERMRLCCLHSQARGGPVQAAQLCSRVCAYPPWLPFAVAMC